MVLLNDKNDPIKKPNDNFQGNMKDNSKLV